MDGWKKERKVQWLFSAMCKCLFVSSYKKEVQSVGWEVRYEKPLLRMCCSVCLQLKPRPVLECVCTSVLLACTCVHTGLCPPLVHHASCPNDCE